jgi:ATP-dependent Lon protease
MNPVIVLDEIDKIGRGHKGDPTSVMLEILDPEQNSSFQDLYLNFDIDLSQCLFIATANTTASIPAPLRDRMEFVWLSSYTPLEKFNIAVNYLIPQELKTHGIPTNTINISQNCIKTIIDNYTREAGVRNLRRVFAKLFRKIARELLKENKQVQIGISNIKKYLKKPIFKIEKIQNTTKIGLGNGLAWTAVGGDTLKIEAVKIKAKGVLSLTGSLGDVMKESAKISHSVVKTILDGQDPNIKTTLYNSFDIHLHIPSGATPKDGPSAGITMAVAMYSILKDVKVWQNIAMTGELSLKGDVLPIGGLKEKLIAAYKAGVKEVLIPQKNYEDDIDEIPKEVLQNVKITPVKTITEVLDKVLEI